MLINKDTCFPRQLRLTSAPEFHNVFARNKSTHHRWLTLLARKNEHGHPRLGLVISKKCAKRAVVRNRIKRVLRETFRANQHELDALDIIAIGKSGLAEMSTHELHLLIQKQWTELMRCKKS